VTIVDAIAILARRWYLVIIGLAVTAAVATFAAYRLVDGELVTRFPPRYETAAVVNVVAIDLASPAAADTGRVAHSVKAIVESGPVAREVADAVPAWRGGSITARVPEQTSLVELLVTGPTADAATAAMDEVLDHMPDTVGSLVARDPAAPGPGPLTVDVTGEPTPPAAQPSTKGALALVLGALLGLAATWTLVLSLDRTLTARAADRPARAATADRRTGGEPETARRATPAPVPSMAGSDGRR
jgi:hypothetical protein